MTNLERFIAEFSPRYAAGGKRDRWDAFLYLVGRLLSKNRSVTIIETGTARQKGNYLGDGQSTLIWEWVARATGGHAFSVDIDDGAVSTAQNSCAHSSFIDIVQEDSIAFLRRSWLSANCCDLLYLDSFDWSSGQKGECVLHHAAELAAVWSNLPHGCLIAVDDCISATEGKHLLVAEFFRIAGIAPVSRGYITIWEKP